MQRLIVTGSRGLVGSALARVLGRPFDALHFAAADWRSSAERADFRDATVIHLAARVHDPHASQRSFHDDNVTKTRELARAAARGGARRFVYLSTAKVYGEESGARPFGPADALHPADPYARSKAEAESALREIARGTGLSIAVVRSPLVFAPGAAANLAALLRLADSPWPLPFAALRNRRSFVHADDLARLLIDCASSAAASAGTFLAAHAQPFSTSQLVCALRATLGRPARLYPVPPRVLEVAASVLGAGTQMRRLTRSFELDASETTRLLGWEARVGLDAAVADLVRGYRP